MKTRKLQGAMIAHHLQKEYRYSFDDEIKLLYNVEELFQFKKGVSWQLPDEIEYLIIMMDT